MIRIPIAINFVLLLVLISPVGRSRELYTTMRNAGFAPLITMLDYWIVGTTLIATVLFFWRRMRKSHVVVGEPRKKATLDGVLLLVWWIVVILVCLYAFSLGMGG